MTRIIDVSVALRDDMPVWPGSPGMSLSALARMAEGSPANVSKLEMDVHTGTHIDAPRHFVADGATTDEIGLEVLMGPARVASLATADEITRRGLEHLSLPEGTRRLLLRTRNSRLWKAGERNFREDYVALTADAAAWVVERGIQVLGIDYLSIQRFSDGPETHRILLENGVVLLEGLDLSAVDPGLYELLCLPLRLVGAEGAPARVVLRTYEPNAGSRS